jgi:hypothetical protein
METVAEAEEEALANTGFPKGHWTQLCKANVQERLKRELKRRMEAVPIFPDRDSRVRLAGHALIGQHGEWMAAERRYMPLAGMAKPKESESGPSCPCLSEENPKLPRKAQACAFLGSQVRHNPREKNLRHLTRR